MHSSERQAGDEIEITEEMIEAGVLVLAGFSPSRDPMEDVCEEIYRAMVRSRRRSSVLPIDPSAKVDASANYAGRDGNGDN
jgi:hypothetical protein